MSADTIVALSSGQLPAGVAVIRASGPAVQALMLDIAGSIPLPKTVHYGAFHDRTGSVIDRGLMLFFKGPSSFTGEDVAEFHVHGSRAVVNALIETCCKSGQVRPAEAGEFMQRAFLNGKVTLLQAEATADLIQAETEAQRRFALSATSERYQDLYQEWRRSLIEVRALLESELDFADEADVPDQVSDRIWPQVKSLAFAMEKHMAGYAKAEVLKNGLDVVLLGVPNSGKSTLLNALVARDAALVSDEAGTTRDLIEVSLELNGMKVRVTDTAGIRRANGKVERMGIERALNRAKSADVVLVLLPLDTMETISFTAQLGQEVLSIGTKSDLSQPSEVEPDLIVSAYNGHGMTELRQKLADLAAVAMPSQSDLVPWKQRHVRLLQTTVDALRSASQPGLAVELRSEELRVSSDALGQIAGLTSMEDLYDSIFSEFCIGK